MELTTVKLNGAIGKRFGRVWKVCAESVTEALQIIEANKPGVNAWMRSNASKFDRYHIKITRADGNQVELSDDSYRMVQGEMKEIVITPVLSGAGAVGRILVGAVLMVSAFWLGPLAFSAGASLALGGIVELLSPTPKLGSGNQRSDNTSYYFDGPVNTSQQGVPVPLIYGRILAGSQVISAKITVDQLM